MAKIQWISKKNKNKKASMQFYDMWWLQQIQPQHRSFRFISKLLWNHQLLPNINLSHTPHRHEGL